MDDVIAVLQERIAHDIAGAQPCEYFKVAPLERVKIVKLLVPFFRVAKAPP